MCSTDYDHAIVYNEKVVTAAKHHICSECGRTILAGEKYKYVFGKWEMERKPSTYKTCAHCLVAQDWLRSQCGTFLHGGLSEEIQEHASDYHKGFLWRWCICIARKWTRPSGELMPIPSVEKSLENRHNY